MNIHVVHPGETPDIIAHTYGVPLWLLSAVNGIDPKLPLVPGQTILILYPSVIHTVVSGDTLHQIAGQYHISLRELYRNNPWLIRRSYIYPGDLVIIRYQSMSSLTASVSGYAYPFIDISLFLQTLPYVTDFHSFTYEITDDGHLTSLGDDLLISLAHKFGTRPLMVVSNLREPYGFEPAIAHKILGDPDLWEPFIEEILDTVITKDYAGVDMDFEYVLKEDKEHYPEFMTMLHSRLSKEGRSLFAAVAAKTSDDTPGALTEGIDYKALGEAVDTLLLMTYEWGYAQGEPMAIAPLPKVKEVLDYAITRVPRKKILLGIPNYGYNWPVTFNGQRRPATSISNTGAVELARSTGATILYDSQAQSPFFSYTQNDTRHDVWFEDARSIYAKLSLIGQYKIKGAGYWNLMRPFPQNWMLLNMLYHLLPS